MFLNKGQCPHSVFSEHHASFFSFSQWAESICSSRQSLREKAQHPASFFWALCLFLCGHSEPFKRLKFLNFLENHWWCQWPFFQQEVDRTRRWRRSWCWPFLCTWSWTISPTKTIITERGKPVCVFVCLCLFMSYTHILPALCQCVTAVTAGLYHYLAHHSYKVSEKGTSVWCSVNLKKKRF